ncbi:unnamed protein product [Paramecium pentaurelia]|uniref:TmcB/TmcC TPR repeats domain-containing protein n=1 Tax=Paramecium pentaurelia TaxID=43138 RepID=A0A8S1X9R4_9CILI|nr:unnamed protein product [Paramecium pentaurelia]
MNNRKTLFEYSKWDLWIHSLKMSIYNLTHNLLLNSVVTVHLYNFLILLETIQMVYYSIHPSFAFLFQTPIFKYFRLILSYFQPNDVLSKGQIEIQLALLYIVFAVQLLMIILKIVILCNLKKHTTFYIYTYRLIAYFGVFFNTILLIPFTNVYIAILYCVNSNFECYVGAYYAHFVFSFLGLFMHFIHIVYFNLIFMEQNPFSTIPFASPQQSATLIKQIIKIVLPIYTIFDYQGSLDRVFISLLCLSYIYLNVQRFKQPKYYNKWVAWVSIIEEVTLLWITLVSFFTAFINYDQAEDIGFFYMIIGIPLVVLVYFHLLHLQNKKVLSILFRNIERDIEAEIYLIAVIKLIRQRKKIWSRMLLEGKLRLHSKACQNKECICKALMLENIKEEEIDQYWYKFLGFLLNEMREKFNKSCRINLLYAFLLNDQLNNHFKALTEMMFAEDNKPSLQEELAMYHYKNIIQQKLKDMEQKTNENKGIDVNGIMVFQNTFIIFLNAVEKTVNYHIEYWRELLETNPDILKLKVVGSKITKKLEQTMIQYQKLQELNSNHIKFLTIYGNFLKEIVNDEDESNRILDRVQILIKQFQNNKIHDQIRLKYGENANTCIITCSGNFNNMGVVTNCNNEITRLLQFSKSDIMGININCIMPKIYASHHDQYMIDYIESSKPKVMDRERILCCINSQQYLVPCSLMIKILPNLDEGIKMVGFLQDYNNQQESNEEWHYIIVDGYTQTILGITQSCTQIFGIPQSIMTNNTFKQKFTFDVLFPNVEEHINMEDGILTYLDTTQLQEDYLQGIGESQSEISVEDDDDQFCEFPHDPLRSSNDTRIQRYLLKPVELKQQDQVSDTPSPLFNRFQTVDFKKKKNDKLQRYKKYKIKLVLCDQLKIGEYNLQTIKFMWIKEDEQSEQIMKMDSMNSKQNQNNQDNKISDHLQPVIEDGNSSRSSRTENNQKELKEFKQMISSKTQPRSIIILKRTVWFIMILLLTLSTLIMAYRVIQSNDVKEGVNAIYQGYYRHNIISDVVYNARKLQLIYNNTYDDDMQIVKSDLQYWVNSLQQLQYDLINVRLIMENRKGNQIQPQKYTTKFLMSNGQESNQDLLFDDAMMYFITSGSQLDNASNDSFIQSSNSGYKNFYFLINNGYYVLRNGSENIANNFYEFYSNLIQDYLIKFLIIMIIGIAFLIISSLVLIPIVSQVHDTNNKVLSLFGIIPVNELKDLVTKCEQYLKNFLNEQGDSHKHTKVQEAQITHQNIIHTSGHGEQPLINKEHQDKQESNEDDASKLIQKPQKLLSSGHQSVSHVKQLSNLTSDGQPQIPIPISQGATKHDLKHSQKKQQQKEEEKDDDQENLKANKLLNSQGSHKCAVTVQFIFFALLFISYFVLDIILESYFLKETQNIFDHLKNIEDRPINIKYYMYLSIEQLLLEDPTSLDTYKNVFQNRQSENERNISIEIQQSHPSQFDSYFSLLAGISFNSLCDYPFTVNQFTLVGTTCMEVQAGLLQQGLKTTIASVALTSNDMLAKWSLSDKTYDDLSQTLKEYYKKLDTIMQYVSNCCYYLTLQYQESTLDYLSYQEMIEQVKFSVFLIIMFFVFIFCMTQYQNNLSEQIWETKGLLNMIPLEIIAKYQHLKEQFVGGEILKAVQ